MSYAPAIVRKDRLYRWLWLPIILHVLFFISSAHILLPLLFYIQALYSGEDKHKLYIWANEMHRFKWLGLLIGLCSVLQLLSLLFAWIWAKVRPRSTSSCAIASSDPRAEHGRPSSLHNEQHEGTPTSMKSRIPSDDQNSNVSASTVMDTPAVNPSHPPSPSQALQRRSFDSSDIPAQDPTRVIAETSQPLNQQNRDSSIEEITREDPARSHGSRKRRIRMTGILNFELDSGEDTIPSPGMDFVPRTIPAMSSEQNPSSADDGIIVSPRHPAVSSRERTAPRPRRTKPLPLREGRRLTKASTIHRPPKSASRQNSIEAASPSSQSRGPTTYEHVPSSAPHNLSTHLLSQHQESSISLPFHDLPQDSPYDSPYDRVAFEAKLRSWKMTKAERAMIKLRCDDEYIPTLSVETVQLRQKQYESLLLSGIYQNVHNAYRSISIFGTELYYWGDMLKIWVNFEVHDRMGLMWPEGYRCLSSEAEREAYKVTTTGDSPEDNSLARSQ